MNEYKIFAICYDWILYPFIHSIRRDVLRIAQNLKPDRIIDICCGTGDQLHLFKQNGIEAMGIDLSRAMLKVAGKRTSPVNCLLQDAAATAFKTHSFDLATVSFALHETEWDNAARIVDEVRRILKPSGMFLIVDYHIGRQSGFLARNAIQVIEFLAGRRHYNSFRQYRQKGGLDQLIDPGHFTPVQDRFHAGNCIVIRLLEKIERGAIK